MVVPNHLISVENFDNTNKVELVQIAHHNAHILNHLKNPIRQYSNHITDLQKTGSLASFLNHATNALPFHSNFVMNASNYGNKQVKPVTKQEFNQHNFEIMKNTTPNILTIIQNSAQTSKPGFRR
jgi:hypothetical protein